MRCETCKEVFKNRSAFLVHTARGKCTFREEQDLNDDRSGEVSVLDSIPVYTGEENVSSWLRDTGLSLSELNDDGCEQLAVGIDVDGIIEEQVKVINVIPSSAIMNSVYLSVICTSNYCLRI